MADAMAVDASNSKNPGYALAHQVIDLDIDFSEQVSGRTEITVYPDSRQLREVKLNAKQCQIDGILVNGSRPEKWSFHDPCDRFRLHASGADVHQHHILDAKVGDGSLTEGELSITLPKDLKIEEVNVTEIHTQTSGTIKIAAPDGAEPVDSTQTLSDTSVAKFTPLKISMDFVSSHLRDGLQFVQAKPGNGRWPQVYTRDAFCAGAVPSVFPCIDSLTARCTWDITIRCPKTVADAVRQVSPTALMSQMTINGDSATGTSDIMSKEMFIVCSGDMTDDVVRKDHPEKKIVSFSCSQQLSARQIGFAIAPFEKVNLSALRDAQDEEELGQNAVELLGFCLPGRGEELRNATLPTAYAMDSIVNKYLSCPFSTYSMCFVDDTELDTSVFAGLTLCSTRMLYPAEVIDPAQEVTRKLVQAIASQWVGVNIVAESPRDTWAIVGISHFMTESFMKDLCGNNEYRYRMRRQSDLAYDLDRERPSMYDIGTILHVDRSEYEFLCLKAPLVLFILDRRIAKVTGTSKMPGIIGKILTRARIGDLQGNLLSTELFQKTCERFYHAKIDDFIQQWVRGAGCPAFTVSQRFNKKKNVIEMTVAQVQSDYAERGDLDENTFMRDAREDARDVYAAPLQPVFTGSMTIRIHEADGTPYEHIVELKDVKTTFDVPYNTKYKRLKRSKKDKAKVTTDGADGENDTLLYALGDVLQNEDEIHEWDLEDFGSFEDRRFGAEPYEWIRADADFEWIARTQIMMPGYMAASMLQQDRDVVAQFDGIRQLAPYNSSRLIASIFLRTMVDERYFHGIRTYAAHCLAKHAQITEENKTGIGWSYLRKAFEELYCTKDHGSIMTRPNDFEDVKSYFVQTAIIEAISQVRDTDGAAPREVKEFLLDKLKFNDNSSNQYSDAFYVSKLMKALCSAVLAKSSKPRELVDEDEMNIDAIDEEAATKRIHEECIGEIDRYRRMDEWTGSYQNLYSRTALECQQMLNRAGVNRQSSLHFLHYTRPGNYDLLRLEAYEVLIQQTIFADVSVLKYILHCMVADSSPLIRQGLSDAFGRALGSRAIGQRAEDLVIVQGQDGVLIEDMGATESRQKVLARTKTLEGATSALREELGADKELAKLLWNAINYPDVGERDLRPLLDFCRLLYDPVDSLKVTLAYPRYWSVEKLGKGKLRFFQTDKIRTKRMEKWRPVPPPPPPPAPVSEAPPKPMKIKFKTNTDPSPSATPPPPAPPPAQPSLGGLKLKLKFKPEG